MSSSLVGMGLDTNLKTEEKGAGYGGWGSVGGVGLSDGKQNILQSTCKQKTFNTCKWTKEEFFDSNENS